MILRRRRLPDHLREPSRAFEALTPELERAKAALTESVPGTRLPGRSLAETLAEFEAGLAAVGDLMVAWRAPEVDDEWRRATAGLETATAMAERIRLEANAPAGFEGLVALVGDLLAPLEPFADAARRFQELRVAR